MEIFKAILDNDEKGILIIDYEGTLVYKNGKTDLFLKDKQKDYINFLFENYIEPRISELEISDFKPLFSDDNFIIKAKTMVFQKKNFIIISIEDNVLSVSSKIDEDMNSYFYYWKAEVNESKFSYVFISKGFEYLTGYKTEDILKGKTSFPEIVYEKDWPLYEDYLLNILSKKQFLINYRIKGKNGELINLIEQAIPLSENNEESLIINGFTFKNFTLNDRNNFSNIVFDALNYLEQSIVITDNTGSIIYVNPSFTKITGYSFNEAIGQNPRILKSGKHNKDFYEQLWSTITSGKVWEGEIINKTKSGKLINQELTIIPTMNRFGEIIYYMAIEKDITEKLKIEEQFYQAQKLEAIGLLAGGIAHSFNNILSGILGYTEILKNRNKEEPDIINVLNKMTVAGEKATKLISQFLGYARKGKMVSENIDLKEQIDEVINIMFSYTHNNINIEKIFESDNFYTKGDSSQIKQVILNISMNAVQAMPDEGTIFYHLYKREINNSNKGANKDMKNGEYAVLAIEDSGIGIKDENKNRIFIPFFTTKHNKEHTGLGLSTVYGIMKNHKGYVNFDSKEGKGSIFYLYFPLYFIKETDKNKNKSETRKHKNKDKEIGKVLIVDDEHLVREMLEEALTEEGYRVISAKDGEDGLKIFNENTDEISLVILDLNMPKKNGRELFFDMKKINSNIRVIIMTGYTLNEQVQELLENGAVDYLKKPFQIPCFLEKVAEYY